jgi:Putative MetA-pathway of phenol degradation
MNNLQKLAPCHSTAFHGVKIAWESETRRRKVAPLSLDPVPASRNKASVRGHLIFFAGLALCASRAALADEQPICADRPGKATSACTVPLGHWQVETGLADWTLQKGAGERDTTLVLGETTVKYGLTDGTDIELDVTPWQRATSRFGGMHESASGIGDVNLILKQRLTSGDAPVQVIAMPMVKIPTANHRVGNGKWEGGLLFPIAYAIPKTPLSLGLTPELDWVADGDGHGHHLAMQQVASLGWAATDKLNLAAEVWSAWDWDPTGTTRQASADGSVAYLLSNDVQLDAGANFGLNRATPDVELYGGISKRF